MTAVDRAEARSTWTDDELVRVWLRKENLCPTCAGRPEGRDPGDCPECWGTGSVEDWKREQCREVWKTLIHEGVVDAAVEARTAALAAPAAAAARSAPFRMVG